MERAGAGDAAGRSAFPRQLSDPARRDAAFGARSGRRPDRAGISQGSVFTRKELREREQQQIDRLAERLQSDLAVGGPAGSGGEPGTGRQALHGGPVVAEPAQGHQGGRAGSSSISRSVLEAPVGSASDIVLRDGDRLIIPEAEAGSDGHRRSAEHHFAFLPRESRARRLHRHERWHHAQGGRGRIYVVRANGSVVSSEGGGWFRRSARWP